MKQILPNTEIKHPIDSLFIYSFSLVYSFSFGMKRSSELKVTTFIVKDVFANIATFPIKLSFYIYSILLFWNVSVKTEFNGTRGL